ncbi:MAG: hypothetical protein CM15mP12_1110 [Gammaproteobacteria bacterium]|nr:MAG: hypothetical protein CM15mP12_1110 [Gammaproteobacteria bacterium]
MKPTIFMYPKGHKDATLVFFKSKKSFYVSDQWQDFQIEFKNFENYGYSQTSEGFKPTKF